MTASTQPQLLLDTGGLAVTREGDRVIVFDRRTGGLSVTMFVLALLAVILVVNGVIVALSATLVGLALVLVGLCAAAAAVMAWRTFRQRRALPLHSCRTVAVLDGKRGLFSAAGGALQQLDRVKFERRFQLASSSPKLVAVAPSGTVTLKRGNPFDGGVGKADEVLNAAVADFAPR